MEFIFAEMSHAQRKRHLRKKKRQTPEKGHQEKMTSKIARANRVGRGNVKNLRQSRLNQARTALGITPKPTTPKPSPSVARPKTITIPARKPAGVSDSAWKIIQARAK